MVQSVFAIYWARVRFPADTVNILPFALFLQGHQSVGAVISRYKTRRYKTRRYSGYGLFRNPAPIYKLHEPTVTRDRWLTKGLPLSKQSC